MINILYLHAGAELYGADIILLNIVKNLDKSKFNPYVILPNNGPLVDKMRENGICCEVIEYPILRRQFMNPIGILRYIYYYFKSIKKIVKFLKEKNIQIDLIHSNTSAVLEGIILKNKLKARLIFHIHEMIDKPRILHYFFSYVFKMFGDLTLCVSNAVQNHLNKVTVNPRIRVIHNGIDTTIFNNRYEKELIESFKDEIGLPKDKLIVGMIGRVNAIKGQSDLIKAFEVVYNSNKNVHLLLVGGVFKGQEWRFQELSDMVDVINKKYGNAITLCDFRSDNYIVHNAFDIFVLPSVCYDSFPTVVLESLACGTPVIAYDCGGVVEMINNGDNGEIIEWKNIKLLAESIQKIACDCELRNKYSLNGINRINKDFSIDSQINNTENLYLEVLN